MSPMRKMRLLNRLQDKQCEKCSRKSCSSLERSQHPVPKSKRKRGISRMKLQKSSTTCHSRRCLSSSSICHTGRSWRYAMTLMVTNIITRSVKCSCRYSSPIRTPLFHNVCICSSNGSRKTSMSNCQCLVASALV